MDIAVKAQTPNLIYCTLNHLIKQKSERDGIPFTQYQLAQALNIRRSILHRLMHPDPARRVTNPRIETLLKIVEFFRKDGFNISLDNFLGIPKTIDIREQNTDVLKETVTIPLFSTKDPSKSIQSSVTLKATANSKSLFALELYETIEPIFEKGSIVIINRDITPRDRNLVAVTTSESPEAKILRYRDTNNQQILEPVINNEQQKGIPICFNHDVLGVVIQINAKI